MNDDHLAAAVAAAADLRLAVSSALAALEPVVQADWTVRAGELDWDCWETVEHLADGMFAYALQLGPARAPLDRWVELQWRCDRPGAPASALRVPREAGAGALLEVVDGAGAMLAAMVRTAEPEARAYHSYGVSDPVGFAAMGIVETLVHADDAARGLGVRWAPPAGPCLRALARLFPEIEVTGDPWVALRWATGRAELPGHEGRRVFEQCTALRSAWGTDGGREPVGARAGGARGRRCAPGWSGGGRAASEDGLPC